MFEFFRLWLLVVVSGMAVAGAVAVLIVGTPLFSRIGSCSIEPSGRVVPTP